MEMNVDPKTSPEISKKKAEAYNKIGIAILNLESDNSKEVLIVEEIRRLRHLKLHTDAQAGLAYDHGWPVLEDAESELRDIRARIEELKEQSIKVEMFREAFKYFKLSAELGDVEGMWNLGWRYLLGEGVEPCPLAANRWWSKAKDLGHQKARECLASTAPTSAASS